MIFDFLLFWKAQSTAFPVLSKMARDILTTPVSTVASEQVFSSTGKLLDERRARLAEDILEALMCVKEWEDARQREQQFVDDMVLIFQTWIFLRLPMRLEVILCNVIEHFSFFFFLFNLICNN